MYLKGETMDKKNLQNERKRTVLKRKHTVLKLYKSRIIGLLSFSALCVYIYIVIAYKLDFITVCSTCALVSLVCSLYRYLIFAYHQLFIPLSRSELEALDIDTADKYLIFLDKYLKGYKPHKQLYVSIAQSFIDNLSKPNDYDVDEYGLIFELVQQKNYMYNRILRYISYIAVCPVLFCLLLSSGVCSEFISLVFILVFVLVSILWAIDIVDSFL